MRDTNVLFDIAFHRLVTLPVGVAVQYLFRTSCHELCLLLHLRRLDDLDAHIISGGACAAPCGRNTKAHIVDPGTALAEICSEFG